MKGPQQEPTGSRLPCSLSHSRGFDAVVDCVAHQMRERIADTFDQGAVEFGVGSVDHQLHLPSTGDGNVPHGARKLVEHMLDRLHPCLDRRLLQGVGDGVDPVDDAFESGVGGFDAAELVAGEDELAHKIENRRQQTDVDPDGWVGSLRSRLDGRRGWRWDDGNHSRRRRDGNHSRRRRDGNHSRRRSGRRHIDILQCHGRERLG